MYTVWHVDKYKITFKLVINWTKEILQHFVVSSGLSRPGIIDARARYRVAARPLRNTVLHNGYRVFSGVGVKRPGRGVDHPPTSSAEVKERVELYIYSSSGPSWPVLG